MPAGLLPWHHEGEARLHGLLQRTQGVQDSSTRPFLAFSPMLFSPPPPFPLLSLAHCPIKSADRDTDTERKTQTETDSHMVSHASMRACAMCPSAAAVVSVVCGRAWPRLRWRGEVRACRGGKGGEREKGGGAEVTAFPDPLLLTQTHRRTDTHRHTHTHRRTHTDTQAHSLTHMLVVLPSPCSSPPPSACPESGFSSFRTRC